MAASTDVERPCTPRKRLELAKEVDRETTEKLNRTNDAATPTTAATINVESPRGGLRDFCESFVGGVVKQASARVS